MRKLAIILLLCGCAKVAVEPYEIEPRIEPLTITPEAAEFIKEVAMQEETSAQMFFEILTGVNRDPKGYVPVKEPWLTGKSFSEMTAAEQDQVMLMTSYTRKPGPRVFDVYQPPTAPEPPEVLEIVSKPLAFETRTECYGAKPQHPMREIDSVPVREFPYWAKLAIGAGVLICVVTVSERAKKRYA